MYATILLLTIQMHNELLAAYVRADKLTEAEQLLLNMQRVGPAPDTVSYNTVLHAFGSRRLHAPLIALWAEMEAAKVPADTQTYGLRLAF